MAYVKRIDENRLSTEQRDLLKEADKGQVGTGVAGDAGQRTKPEYTERTDRRAIEAPDNAAATNEPISASPYCDL